MDMLRRIGKQSGESVESVLKAGQDKGSVMTENHVTDWDNVKATVMLRVFLRYVLSSRHSLHHI